MPFVIHPSKEGVFFNLHKGAIYVSYGCDQRPYSFDLLLNRLFSSCLPPQESSTSSINKDIPLGLNPLRRKCIGWGVCALYVCLLICTTSQSKHKYLWCQASHISERGSNEPYMQSILNKRNDYLGEQVCALSPFVFTSYLPAQVCGRQKLWLVLSFSQCR